MIAELDGQTAPESTLAAFHLVESEADPHDFGEPPRALAEAIASYRNPGSARRRHWLATDGGEPAGAAVLSQYGGSLVIGSVMVRPAFRRRGIGRALFGVMVAAARADGVRSFFGEHSTPDGAAFARAMDAVDDQPNIVSVLDLRATELPAPVPPAGVELRRWIGAAPDELLGSLVRARNAMADAPVPGGLEMPAWTLAEQRRDEERQIARGTPQHVTVAVANGEVLALTGIRVPDADGASIAHTDDTATVPHARRRGLATCVKLDSLRTLRAGQPGIERVMTQNAAQNEGMLALNLKVGFVPVLELTPAVVAL
ncbi:MAG TPA: GNAT family N-acetyltransferase [Gaiellaceae bacterium]